jgi:hypothetical protein
MAYINGIDESTGGIIEAVGSGLSLSTNSEGLAELSASDDEKKNKYEETGLLVVTSSNNTLIFSIAGDNFSLTLTEGIYSGDELALHIYTLMGFGFYHISYNNKTNKFTLSDAADNSGTIANFPGGDETEIYTGTTALDILGISSSDLTTQAANDTAFFFFPYISTTTPVLTPLNTIFNSKQNAITAGTNLSFSGNTLNASSSAPTITASRVCVSDTNGNLTASAVSTTDLNLLEGINSSTSSGTDGKVIRRGIRTVIGKNSVTTGTHNGISNCSVNVVGAASNQNNWSGAKASNEFNGHLAIGGDFDGAYIGLSVDWDVRMRHGYFQSDDRCKHFERETANCLDKVMALKPKTYVKTRELYDADFVMSEDGSNRKEGDILTPECGFIAQEVAEAGDVEGFEELRYSVTGGDYEDEDGNVIEKEFLLNYNNLFCLAVGAIKELKLEVETLKTQITELTSS